jgi:DNA processing protein
MQFSDSALSRGWDKASILALCFLPGVNSVLIRRIIGEYSCLEHFFSAPPSFLRNSGQLSLHDTFINQPDSLYLRAQEALHEWQERGIYVSTFFCNDYPALLRHIDYPPALLYYRGNMQNLHQNIALGIVGTRHCTVYGRQITEKFADMFCRAGVAIISGLAYGIDTIAHQYAVKSKGITYAVIASGPDKISPYTSERLAASIVESGGGILSEYMPGTKALPAYFPQRNRIISGISRAILVIESGIRGGSLITAQFANDQNRDVYAVPGPLGAPKSQGTNLLIRHHKASLAISPEDILQDLDIPIPSIPALPECSIEEKQILHYLTVEPVHIDVLAQKTGRPVHEISLLLLSLEFAGYIQQLAGKHFIRLQ